MKSFAHPYSRSLRPMLIVLGMIVPLTVNAASEPGIPSTFAGKISVSARDAAPSWPVPARAPKGAPNIVLILLDDVGFADCSTYGGPIETPALSALSQRGIHYNNFHAVGVCSPSRASLLSGRNHHRVGWGDVGQAGFPGYNGIWPKAAAPVAEVLRRNGYSTSLFGKWHNTPAWESSAVGPFDHWPTSMGFEHFYGFLDGFTSQWEPGLWRNTVPVDPPAKPEQGYHFTSDIVDESIKWIRTHQTLAPSKPYLLYLAPGAAHFPHHAPKSWIDKYRGHFDSGWDVMRAKTFQRQKDLGLIPPTTELTPRPKELPAWDSLSLEEKQLFARQMEVYAGFLAHTDHEIGRLLEAVRQGPGGENTAVIYIVSDNGSSSEGGIEGSDEIADTLALVRPATPVAKQLAESSELGTPRRINHYASGWGWAGTTPFQWSKQMSSHLGATRVPLVISWPTRIKPDQVVRPQFTHLVDIVPTIYEMTRIESPGVIDGTAQMEFDGTSLAYTFDSAAAPSQHRIQYFEVMGNRSIYHDGWMASARHSLSWIGERSDNFDADKWELYHLARDFSQAHDVAAQYPEKLAELKQLFDAEAWRNGVYPLQKWLPGPPEFMRTVNQYPTPNWIGGPPELKQPARQKVVYRPGLPRMAPIQNFSQSFSLTADLSLSNGKDQGVIVSAGGRFGGFVLYVNANRQLVYESNSYGRKTGKVISSIRLTEGANTLSCRVEKSADLPLNAKGDDRRGVTLFVNDMPAGTGRLPFGWTWFGRSFGIGRTYDSPAGDGYDLPFAGEISEVLIEVGSQ